jgi:RNA polymerase sigma-70 factor (ECF subfamily)
MQRQPPPIQDDRQAVFTRLVQEHAKLLYRVAWSVLRHVEDAEDCVQETLLKLFRGESWRHMENERAFLASTIWRMAVDRRKARQPSKNDGTELKLEDTRPTPEMAVAEGDERALLRALIGELPEDLRETLLLSAMEEMNSREIGEVMGLPEGTVRTRLMRARAGLRARWEAKRGAVSAAR